MKNIKILLVVILMQFILQCKAQSPIVSLYDGDHSIPNSYHKDLDNDLDKFVGTWRCVRNDTTLIVKLRKKEMHHSTIFTSYYQDLLIGEYQCVVNGIEISNTLSRLNMNFINEYDYTICLGLVTKACRDCPTNKREVRATFTEQDRKHIRNGKVQIRHIDLSGQEFIRFNFYSSGIEHEYPGDPTTPWTNKFNYGVYLMEKI